jgi:hypothetical protein
LSLGKQWCREQRSVLFSRSARERNYQLLSFEARSRAVIGYLIEKDSRLCRIVAEDDPHYVIFSQRNVRLNI